MHMHQESSHIITTEKIRIDTTREVWRIDELHNTSPSLLTMSREPPWHGFEHGSIPSSTAQWRFRYWEYMLEMMIYIISSCCRLDWTHFLVTQFWGWLTLTTYALLRHHPFIDLVNDVGTCWRETTLVFRHWWSDIRSFERSHTVPQKKERRCNDTTGQWWRLPVMSHTSFQSHGKHFFFECISQYLVEMMMINMYSLHEVFERMLTS